MKHLKIAYLAAILVGCAASTADPDAASGPDSGPDVEQSTDTADESGPTSLTVMVFNVGTTKNLSHAADQDGYSDSLADVNASLFGNNLAWMPAQMAVRELVDSLTPDVIAFQELFFDPDCEKFCKDPDGMDSETRELACEGDTFPCGSWQQGSEITVQRIVGPAYAIACAPDHPDNCIAVLRKTARLEGADDHPQIGLLDGMRPPDECTRGARVATGMVHVENGPSIAVVNVHATAGTAKDCRKTQFRQIFEDRGDGKPAAFGEYNLVMGDMNIDPFLEPIYDQSIIYWNQHVGEDKPFRYVSSSDASGPSTHPYTFMKLDHVISDRLSGSCVVLGQTEGTLAPISESSTYFDHRPLLCTIDLPLASAIDPAVW